MPHKRRKSNKTDRIEADTPTRAKVRGIVDYLEQHDLPHTKIQVFRHCGVSKATGWHLLAQDAPDRTLRSREPGAWHAPPILNQAQKEEIILLLEYSEAG